MQSVEHYLLQLQENICNQIAALDGKQHFRFDEWTKEGNGGGGRSGILEEGNIFEKAGVNFSHIQGEGLPAPATAKYPHLAGCRFHAMGVSLVFHPLNPYVPTTHMNVRFFMAMPKQEKNPIWWFGGGFDLTPYYGFVEDCIHWHTIAAQICAPFGQTVYPQFKKQCDEYFYLPHRKEARGIGGIFFDDLNQWDFETCFTFMRNVGDGFLKAYIPIVTQRQSLKYGELQKQFQLYRRGRYVEFNLIYDRGTHFGLQFGGRTESILMSLPPQVSWRYNWQPGADTEEAKLTQFYLQPRSWVSLDKVGEK